MRKIYRDPEFWEIVADRKQTLRNWMTTINRVNDTVNEVEVAGAPSYSMKYDFTSGVRHEVWHAARFWVYTAAIWCDTATA